MVGGVAAGQDAHAAVNNILAAKGNKDVVHIGITGWLNHKKRKLERAEAAAESTEA